MATGSPAIDITEQVLVNPVSGVTARIHSPAKAEQQFETKRATARPFRCNYIQRQWMRIGQAIGLLAPMSLAIALVTPIYLVAISTIDTLGMTPFAANNTIIGCVGVWMIVTVFTSAMLAPFMSASFGYHVRRTILPIDVVPSSMHRLFIEMRLVIAALVGSQIVASAMGYFYLASNAPLQMWTNWHPILIGSSIFLGLGIAILTLGRQAFLHTRGRKIHRWFSQCWRGVALRSFIPAWDNQRRAIFTSCRASRRLAAAYRSIKLGAAGCFAAAGCLAAMSVGDSFIGIVFVVASVIATASIWPTADRIVDWSKIIVDPVTGDIDED